MGGPAHHEGRDHHQHELHNLPLGPGLDSNKLITITFFSAVPFVLTEGNIHDPLVLINHLITSDYVVQEPHSLRWLDNWSSSRVQRH